MQLYKVTTCDEETVYAVAFSMQEALEGIEEDLEEEVVRIEVVSDCYVYEGKK